MLDQTHPYLFVPQGNFSLWRYMDLTKFLSLLETRSIFLSRADKFEDPYEGTVSAAGLARMQDEFRNVEFTDGSDSLEVFQGFLKFLETVRKEMFLSCWYRAEHESAAMWKLYLQTSEGVAIRTDHGALSAILHSSKYVARVSEVRYVDYNLEPVTAGNLLYPFVHKRMSFSHENEVRVIVWSQEQKSEPFPAEATSIQIDCAPEDLIKAVHVSPTAPTWFGDLVEKLVARYGISVPVERSNLYTRNSF